MVKKSQNLVNVVCERPLVINLMPFKENQHCWCALKCTLSVSNRIGQIVNTIFYAHSLLMVVWQWCYLENPLQGPSWQIISLNLALTDRNTQIRFCLKVYSDSIQMIICVFQYSTTSDHFFTNCMFIFHKT